MELVLRCHGPANSKPNFISFTVESPKWQNPIEEFLIKHRKGRKRHPLSIRSLRKWNVLTEWVVFHNNDDLQGRSEICDNLS
ncbi:hypothetical protein TNCT_228191 [Trichonephila clavata]|uniref:Uncharacterized protein n=1 Tax=Trichonephila clavata TaxID=2740835 RepID=A0A8X6K3H4_TRICU|nr:hypothetical protein TNCT_228191 [Trichonephila clavata]